MRIENLPSPGPIGQGLQLRTVAAKAISYVEVMAGLSGNGKSSTAGTLSAFFAACKAAADAVADTVAPTKTTQQISAAAPTLVTIVFNEDLDANYVPAASAFALATPAKTISKVQVSGKNVILTVTAAYVVGDTTATVAYTQPGGAGNLRDLSGNLVASWTAATIARVA